MVAIGARRYAVKLAMPCKRHTSASAILLVAQLRLHVAYACHERVGRESLLGCLPLEVIELVGQHLTVRVALHGLVRQAAVCSEGVPPERQVGG